MSKRVLITGASGLLGRAVYKEFLADTSWQVLGLAFSRASGNLRKVDLTKSEEVKQVVNEFKPNVVIHSAAERRPDVVEKQADATRLLNVQATKDLCEAAASVGAWVVYISTDYVFDGKNPPYNEDATPQPLNKYGQSKLDGENVTLEVSKANGVLRVPILYAEVETLSESAVTVLFDKVKDTKNNCVMNDYERRYPTHCGDIAAALRKLCDEKLKNPDEVRGYYHWSGDENMTKFDMAITMAEAMGISTSHIQADKNPSVGAPRPYNAHLGCKRLEKLEIVNQRTLKGSIVDILKGFV